MNVPSTAEELSDAVRIAGRRLSLAIRQGRSAEALRQAGLIRRLRKAWLETRLRRERLRVAERAAALRHPEIPAASRPTALVAALSGSQDVHDVHSNFSSPVRPEAGAADTPRRVRLKRPEIAHGPP
jgi:hypothetical protein